MRSKCKSGNASSSISSEEGVTKKEKGRSTRLGLNADAEEVFEDENGVRYVAKNGIRISQKVAMRPTRAGVESAFR